MFQSYLVFFTIFMCFKNFKSWKHTWMLVTVFISSLNFWKKTLFSLNILQNPIDQIQIFKVNPKYSNSQQKHSLSDIHLFKVNNENAMCEICSKLTVKTPERRHWRRPDVFIVNSEHISHVVLVFPLLTLNK